MKKSKNPKKHNQAKASIKTRKNTVNTGDFSIEDVLISAQQKRNSSEMREIGIDEEFLFNCKQCGKCCIDREDILLSPYDVYRAAKELKMTPTDFYNKYCEMYIGPDSHMVITRLIPRGSIKRCPLLKDRKCSIHNAKPTVCAMFPIGRLMITDCHTPADMNDKTQENYRYIISRHGCGREETHTVREWLENFNIPLCDQAFIEWCKFQVEITKILRAFEEANLPDDTLMLARLTVSLIYLNYDINKEFMPQFLEMSNDLLSIFTLLKETLIE